MADEVDVIELLSDSDEAPRAAKRARGAQGAGDEGVAIVEAPDRALARDDDMEDDEVAIVGTTGEARSSLVRLSPLDDAHETRGRTR